jgi:hypothetical protein
MTKSLLVSLLTLVAMNQAGICGAAVRYGFQGEVEFIFGNPFFGITPQLGDPFYGRIRYEPGGTDDNPDPQVSRFGQSPPASIELIYGGKSFATNGNFFTYVQNNNPADHFQASGGVTTGGSVDTILVDGVPQLGNVEIFLTGNSDAIWPTDALPTQLDLGDFSFADAEIYLNVGLPSGVRFNITALYVVPEPACGTLLMVAAISLVFRRRRRR